MAARAQSLRLSDRYARQLKRTATRVEQIATSRWRLEPEDFDGSYSTWLDVVVPVVEQAQVQNLRLTRGYLTAFIASETGSRTRLPSVDPDEFVGRSRDGRPLREAWTSPPIKAKMAVGEGKTPEEASDIARDLAIAAVGLDVYSGGRGPLSRVISSLPMFSGWRRVPVGETCAACLGLSDGSVMPATATLHIHAGCDCVQEPVVRDVADTARRPTGEDMFGSMTEARQAESIGDAAADAVRSGQVKLSDLVGRSSMANEADWITQRPLSEAL